MAAKKDIDSADIFNKNRIIYFSGIFSEEKVQDTVKKLLEFEVHDPTKDIVIFIDTNGGYLDSFLAIHDTIKMLRSNVVTICLGKAMSCGMLLLMSGQKGKRFITKNSRILVHELSSSTSGKLTDMEIDVKETQRLRQIVESLILEYTKINPENIKDFMSKDTYCDPEKARELGIIDYVITSWQEFFSKLNI